MPAFKQDLRIEQGTSWSVGFKPKLNGSYFLTDEWAIKAQVRRNNVLLHEWSTVIGNADITDQAAVLTVTPLESSAWNWEVGRYDLEVSSAGVTYRIAEGAVVISPEATR